MEKENGCLVFRAGTIVHVAVFPACGESCCTDVRGVVGTC